MPIAARKQVKGAQEMRVPSEVRLYPRFHYSDDARGGPLAESLIDGLLKGFLIVGACERDALVAVANLSTDCGDCEVEGVPQVVNSIAYDRGEETRHGFLHAHRPGEFPVTPVLGDDYIWFSLDERIDSRLKVVDMKIGPFYF